ncbi:hypothetical protein [Caudoviricetes sp.]|nr:hypothetical protein [Caudoviricetes sp.]
MSAFRFINQPRRSQSMSRDRLDAALNQMEAALAAQQKR